MTNQSTNSPKPPSWFWIVSVLAFIWNGMGVYQYLQQAYKTESFKSMVTQEQLEIIENLPSWYTAVFAIAVFAGILGCLALLLRKKWASGLLLLSMVAVIIQMGYGLLKGYSENIGMTIAIIVVAIFLVWFSKNAKAKEWLV